LDDVPVVLAKESRKTERIAAKYQEVCEICRIPLAENCPDHEKAFVPSTFGTVLGIGFDSITMEWSLSSTKEENLQRALDEFMTKKACDLNEGQKIHGKLANFAQACGFMKGFRFNLLQLMGKFDGKNGVRKLIPEE
jgi:hypothetical protein